MPKPNVREKILNAGHAVFKRQGFNGTSVQDVTETAGVPKGSFYNHFPSKEALGVAVLERYGEGGQAVLAALQDASEPPLARLRAFFERMRDLSAEDNYAYGCLMGAFGAELANQSPAVRGCVEAYFAEWTSHVAGVIREAQATGQATTALGADELANFIMNAWQGAILRAKVQQDAAPYDLFLDVAIARVLAP
jgi:TetR/AcrR family transcriptional repressor of nem operon